MLRNCIALLCLLLFTLMLPMLAYAQDATFEATECPFSIALGVTIDCGYVTVPADYNQPDGDTIRLAVAILRTANPQPRPDPLIFLQGGPGGSTIQLELLNMPRLFASVLKDRDVVLFDQRGTSLSEPRLDCPEMVDHLLGSASPQIGGTMSDEMLGSLRECHNRLIGQGINLGDYTTAQSAADVAAVWEALSYKQVNLYGVSYGTRLALEVMRRHADGVRSVILDSVLPPTADIAGDEAAVTARAFDQVFARCAADTVCNLVYPDPRSTFYGLVETYNTEPLRFSAVHPQTEQTVDVEINGDQLAEILAGLLPNPATAAFIPALIYDIRTGDTRLLERLLFPSFDPRLVNLSNTGMQYAVMCNDYLPLLADGFRGTGGDGAEYVFSRIGLAGSGQLPLICEQFGFSPPVSPDVQPVTSRIPTLLLAGEADPLTPLEWAAEAATTLENHHFVTFPGQGHALVETHSPCVTSISQAFLDDPAAAPSLTCIDEMELPPMMLTAGGTRPFAWASALLLGGVAVWGTGMFGRAVARQRWGIAWRMSFRLMGWFGIVGAIAGILFLVLGRNDAQNPFPFANAARAVETVIPLVIGLQAALAFSPDDEPGVEVLLACPRPVAWLLLERLGLILLVFSGVAVISTVMTLSASEDANLAIALARWAAPSLFFAGVAAYITIRARQTAFSVAMVAVVWFIFSFMGDMLLPGLPTFWPLSLVQPFLWPFHAFLQPGTLSISDYWINRVVVGAFGVGLILLAVYQLRNEERVLFGVLKSKRRLLRTKS